MKTTPAVQNEMVYTIFPLSLAEGIKRHPCLFVPSSAFLFLCVNKDNIRKFFILMI